MKALATIPASKTSPKGYFIDLDIVKKVSEEIGCHVDCLLNIIFNTEINAEMEDFELIAFLKRKARDLLN